MENTEKHSIRKRDKVKHAVHNLFYGKEPLQQATESYSALDKFSEAEGLSLSSAENVSTSIKCEASVPENAKKPKQDALSKEGINEMGESSGSNDLSSRRQGHGHEMENPEGTSIRKRDKVKQVVRYIFHGKGPEKEPTENYSSVLSSNGGEKAAVNMKYEALGTWNAKKPDSDASSEEGNNELGESSGSIDLSPTGQDCVHEMENPKKHPTRKRDKLKQLVQGFFDVKEPLQEATESNSLGKLTKEELQSTSSGQTGAGNIKCDVLVAENVTKSDPESSSKETKYELGESSDSNNLLPKAQVHGHEMEHTEERSIGKWVIMKHVIHMRFEAKEPAKEKPENYTSSEMVRLEGTLRVNVIRGSKLATRDIVTSDPYVILTLGGETRKTDVIWNSLNPEWNQSLVLKIPDGDVPLKLEVCDKDIGHDDKMGDAEIDIGPFLRVAEEQERSARRSGSGGSKGNGETKILGIYPMKDDNSLATDSKILKVEGRVQQKMIIQLENVERGLVEIELEYVLPTR